MTCRMKHDGMYTWCGEIGIRCDLVTLSAHAVSRECRYRSCGHTGRELDAATNML